jgi:tight adherence protein B
MILILAVIALGFCVPPLLKHLKREKDRERLQQQLRESLQCIVHGLRTGTGLMQALAYAAEEGEAPLSLEWKRLLQTVNLGQPWSAALAQTASRVPIKEMGWFVSAVQITQSTGGSLAQVLETLASTLQEQQTLREKVKALTAQGKASGAILTALPFLLLAALSLMNPAMVMPMFMTVKGQVLLSAMLVLLSVGGFFIYRIVSIKVD